uniref:Uncharacterized protein n=1 Tax=Siphoviridae sp. ct6d71 TaxID=2826298 RepID=A0A8S5R2S1_9CAUD|nr:MAG TPA: hypothetical protein [Siphoviridae sp. ct6d71]
MNIWWGQIFVWLCFCFLTKNKKYGIVILGLKEPISIFRRKKF